LNKAAAHRVKEAEIEVRRKEKKMDRQFEIMDTLQR
jgi:hypothetical protein